MSSSDDNYHTNQSDSDWAASDATVAESASDSDYCYESSEESETVSLKADKMVPKKQSGKRKRSTSTRLHTQDDGDESYYQAGLDVAN
jgi:hypothetical protein